MRRCSSRCPPALIWNALLAYPVFGARPPARRRDRARGAGAGGGAPCLTHRTASGATPRRASFRPIRPSARRTGSRRASRSGSACSGSSRSRSSPLLFFRLWSLQVLSGARYLDAAQNNQLRTIRVEAPRGPILDREGRVIVGNVPGTAVKLWVGDMPKKEGRYRMIKRLAAVLDVPTRPPRARGRRARRSTRSRRSPSRRPCTTTRSTTCRSTRPSSPASRSSRRTCAATRTSRSARRSSATSARSRRPS